MSEPTPLEITPAPAGGCGCHDHDQIPELDARVIPHAIRHGAVLGALSQVRPGAAMILVAPHNPLPLLAQIQNLENDAVRMSYLQEGPDAWKVLLERTA